MQQVKFCAYCGRPLSCRRIDGKEYQACSADGCEYVHWNNPLPVVAALILHQGDVLLARNRQWPPKVFSLITGFLEQGESPEAAVLREVKEELGLDARLVKLIGVYSFSENNQVIIAYALSATGDIRLNEELAEVKAVPPDKLRSWSFGTGLVVKDWLDQQKRDKLC
jgi:NAD+ diphosphatase